MLELKLPDNTAWRFNNLVLDFNGTIAADGALLDGVQERLVPLADSGFSIYIITADTHGSTAAQCAQLPVTIVIKEGDNVAQHKKELVEALGAQHTVSIGNGRNDCAMFESSALSIAVIGKEGCFTTSALSATIIVTSVLDALDLLLYPKRLLATLRG